MKTVTVLTLQREHHPAWKEKIPFRLVISKPTKRVKTFVLSEMGASSGEMLPPGVEVWVEKSKGLTSYLILRRSNEGDPYIECYELSIFAEEIVEDDYGDRSYSLTLEQGDYLRELGVEVCD